MPELTENALFGLAALALVPVLGFHRRWGAPWLLLLAVALGAVLVLRAGLVPADAWQMWSDTGLGGPMALLLLWGLFGAAARAAGRPRLFGPPLLMAPLAGVLLGEWAGAALMAAGAKDRAAAARLALAAAGGGLCSPVGDPARLLFASSGVPWELLAAVGVLAILIARPRADDLLTGPGDIRITLIGVLVAAGALIPGALWLALGLGTLALAFLGRRSLRPASIARATVPALVGLVVAVAVLGGTAELAVLGLGELAAVAPDLVGGACALGGAMLSALTGGMGASLMADAVASRGMDLDADVMNSALLVGVGMGGLGPLLAADALRAGMFRWLAQVLGALLIVGFLV